MTVNQSLAERVDGEARAARFRRSMVGSRLRPPRSCLQLVRRDGLLRELTAGDTAVLAVFAPGGYGKTIALAQWVEADPRPNAWLQADEADDDPLLFLAYLLAALENVVELDPRVADWMQQAPPPVATRILPTLAGAVARASPFLFVIDDVHLVTNIACWQMVEVIVDQLPAGARACLAGRAEPPLPLARLRAEGRLQEIGPAELALTAAEIGELLELQGVPPDPATVAYLARVTEGWAAGLYLAALAGADVPRSEWLAGIQGHRRDIAGYLASEVLDRAPPAIRRFLLQTSILERLSPGLCRAVTGNPDAGDLLRIVARDNLFVSALDEGGEWFRYHHLFAEFLRAELARDDEAEVRAVHARAAGWFEAHDGLEEAVRHWLAAGEPGRAGSIVCRTHMDYGRTARHETTRRWLEMFTDEQIYADPALTLVAGLSGPMSGDTPRGRRWMATALRADVGQGTWPGADVPLRAMQAILVGSTALGGVRQMRRCAEEALALSAGVDLTTHAAAAALLGQALWLEGDAQAAAPYLRQAVDEGAVAHCLAQLMSLGYQGLALADAGRWAEAREKVDAGLARFGEAGLSWGMPHLPLLFAQTRVAAHDGDPETPMLVATIKETIDRPNIVPFIVLTGRALVAEILADRGDLAGAERWMHSGFSTLATYPDAGMLGPRLLRLRDLLDQRRMVDPLTPAERAVLELLAAPLTLKEIAARLEVSPETVHTHVASIYRKLDAHVRSEAIERARALRLLRA